MTIIEFLEERFAEDEQIVARYSSLKEAWAHDPEGGNSNETLRELATIYSDHPDYNVEWAPERPDA